MYVCWTDVCTVLKPSRIPIPVYYNHPELWRSYSENCLYANEPEVQEVPETGELEQQEEEEASEEEDEGSRGDGAAVAATTTTTAPSALPRLRPPTRCCSNKAWPSYILRLLLYYRCIISFICIRI